MTACKAGWSRREVTGGIALFALALGIPAAGVKLTDLDAEDQPDERQQRLIAEVADLVIPRTETPGAADVGVGPFVVLALGHGLGGTRAPLGPEARAPALTPFLRRDGSLRHLAWLEHALDRAAGGDFLRQPAPKREALLAALDAEAFAQGAAFSPWTAVKGLVLTGYYTSEAGGSQELRYELVPGKWEWDLPLKPGDRAFSSDWTAVDFG